MLIIRLQRTGKKNQADFRIVLAEKASPVEKKFTEVLGSYNPRKKAFVVKPERVKYWLDQHIALSPTVHNLFVTHKVMEGAKVKAFSTPKKPAEPVVAEKPAEAAPAESAPAEAPAAEAAPAETPAPEAAPAPEQPAA